MRGIIGIVNYTQDIKNQEELLKLMFQHLDNRENNIEAIFMDNNINLGYRGLLNTNNDNPIHPISLKINSNTYTIVYSGNIYNIKDIKNILLMNGFTFESEVTDEELILKAYIYYGKEICNFLNGVFSFAIWNENEKELFISRDRFGIKPLYYCMRNGNFIFASEIKALLKHPNVKAQIDETRNWRAMWCWSSTFTR